jgi:hypothetical protein
MLKYKATPVEAYVPPSIVEVLTPDQLSRFVRCKALRCATPSAAYDLGKLAGEMDVDVKSLEFAFPELRLYFSRGRLRGFINRNRARLMAKGKFANAH